MLCTSRRCERVVTFEYSTQPLRGLWLSICRTDRRFRFSGPIYRHETSQVCILLTDDWQQSMMICLACATASHSQLKAVDCYLNEPCPQRHWYEMHLEALTVRSSLNCAVIDWVKSDAAVAGILVTGFRLLYHPV